jgi:hypothetical protein
MRRYRRVALLRQERKASTSPFSPREKILQEREENAALLTLVDETTLTGNTGFGVEQLATAPARISKVIRRLSAICRKLMSRAKNDEIDARGIVTSLA